MDIKYEIKHHHTRYIAFKNGVEIGSAPTRIEAQKMIDEDKAKRKQFRVTWIAKMSIYDLQTMDLEAKDANQAKIKVQQLHMDDLYKIVSVEEIQ